ncbi:MAG TPA: putative sulfate exporter family transporter [Sphingomonadaceae bacterium]|nr:putative sulfate exporter family transporter [Sphingomonadaceae bacterium]
MRKPLFDPAEWPIDAGGEGLGAGSEGRETDVVDGAALAAAVRPTAFARMIGPPRALAPGLAVVAAVVLAAGFVADHAGAPLTLLALLIGLALNGLRDDARLAPGLAFASRTLLRVAIVLLGARVTVAQIADLGVLAFLAVATIVAATIAVAVLAARAMGLGAAFGALAGGAVAICGASAALAFAALLGEKRVGRAQLSIVLVGISAFSAAAMFLYPLLMRALGVDSQTAGFVVGASIHDVAQALGAGFSLSAEAGETASVVKLTRVALLAPALGVVALFLRGSGGGEGRGAVEVPWFVLGFFALAALNSAVALPAAATAGAGTAATWLLAGAVAATGIRSPLGDLLKGGPRPLLVIAIASTAALGLSLAAALLLVR